MIQLKLFGVAEVKREGAPILYGFVKKRNKMKYSFDKMAVGDSFEVEAKNINSVRQLIWQYQVRNVGVKFKTKRAGKVTMVVDVVGNPTGSATGKYVVTRVA